MVAQDLLADGRAPVGGRRARGGGGVQRGAGGVAAGGQAEQAVARVAMLSVRMSGDPPGAGLDLDRVPQLPAEAPPDDLLDRGCEPGGQRAAGSSNTRQVVVACANSVPSGPNSRASAVASCLPQWITLPSARTRPTLGDSPRT